MALAGGWHELRRECQHRVLINFLLPGCVCHSVVLNLLGGSLVESLRCTTPRLTKPQGRALTLLRAHTVPSWQSHPRLCLPSGPDFSLMACPFQPRSGFPSWLQVAYLAKTAFVVCLDATQDGCLRLEG